MGASRLALMASGGAPEHWDFTLLPFAPLIRRLLDQAGASTVIEVGADRGDFTAELLDWAAGAGAQVVAVDPEPAPALLELAEARPELRLVRERSPAALEGLPGAEAIVLDGDHNYATLSAELRAIADRSAAAGEPLPLLLIHDLGWPHARRDTYYAPEAIPAEQRQPLAEDVMVAPGEPGAAAAGIEFRWAAAREGGPRNGLLTAVEDFLEGRDGLRFAFVPAFFGLGAIWPSGAPWSERVAVSLEPFAGSPMLERLERLRIAHITDRVRMHRQEEVLRGMLSSRAFALGDRAARLLGRSRTPFSRERIRRALGERQD